MQTEDKSNGSPIKPFADHGHFTPIHDSIIDVVMPMTPPSAFKVLMFVLRKTRGWQKEEDQQSMRQIMVGCGIGSLETTHKAVTWLIENGLLTVRKGPLLEAYSYTLNRDFELSGVTETVAGRVTETDTPSVTETVTTNRQLKRNNYSTTSNEVVEPLPPKLVKIVATLRSTKNWDKGEEKTQELVVSAVERYGVDHVKETAENFAFKVNNGIHRYTRTSKAFTNWLTSGRNGKQSGSVAPRIRSKEV